MDQITLVDLFDNELGGGTKEEAHRKGLLHRAFSVFLYKDNKMLLQKRAKDKYHSGGLWTNACCSHPRYSEELEDAVSRRLKEELGIEGIQCDELFSFVYYHRFSDQLFEYEYDHVFTGEYDGPVLLPDPDEVEELRFVDMDELAQEMKDNPQAFSVWFLTAAPKVMEYLKAMWAMAAL